MGSIDILFQPDEIKKLSKRDRRLLRDHIVRAFMTNPEITNLLTKDKELLSGMITRDPRIKKILRRKAKPFKDALTHKDAEDTGWVPNVVTPIKRA